MKYTLEKTIEQYLNGEPQKFLFFWGHRPSRDGSIVKSCFSQWFESPFEVEGITYKTAEHWMMVKKAELFEDEEIKAKILVAKSAAEAKKLGREVRNFKPEIWDAHKFEFVVEGNQHKFEQHPKMSEFLLNTNNRILVEASPYDKIWGIGMAQDHKDILRPDCWKGENLLGFALMEVRDSSYLL
jgi:ribA/ribD-fused uncharacterized protein